MADQIAQHIAEAPNQERALLIGGSLTEEIIGIGATVLAIIALVGFLPESLASIAVIAIGAAFMFEGGAISRQLSDILAGTNIDTNTLGYGMTAEFLTGMAGIALGVLSLLNIVPMVLLPAAAILFGGGFIAGTSMTSRLSHLAVHQSGESDLIQKVSREAISAAGNVRILMGLGLITLGVLALVGISPMILSTIAILGAAFTELMSGTALSGHLISLFSGE